MFLEDNAEKEIIVGVSDTIQLGPGLFGQIRDALPEVEFRSLKDRPNCSIS